MMGLVIEHAGQHVPDLRLHLPIALSGPIGDLALQLFVAERVHQPDHVLIFGHSRRAQIVEFVVHAAGHSGIDLYCEDTPGRARRRLEKLGKAWRLSCKSYGGELRSFDIEPAAPDISRSLNLLREQRNGAR